MSRPVFVGIVLRAESLVPRRVFLVFFVSFAEAGRVSVYFSFLRFAVWEQQYHLAL